VMAISQAEANRHFDAAFGFRLMCLARKSGNGLSGRQGVHHPGPWYTKNPLRDATQCHHPREGEIVSTNAILAGVRPRLPIVSLPFRTRHSMGGTSTGWVAVISVLGRRGVRRGRRDGGRG
jgi:hypothetical protein